jgi:hypothetical protein
MSIQDLVILYVTDASLIVYVPNKQPKSIIFPKTLVENKNILDKDAFSNLLTDQLFMVENKECVVVLGSGILYQKTVAKDTDEDITGFYEELPFAQHSLAKKKIETETKQYFLVTNKDFLDSITSVCDTFNARVHAVIPLSLFTDDISITELPDTLQSEIRTNETLFAAGDFLSEKTTQKDSPAPLPPKVEEEPFIEETMKQPRGPVSVSSGWSKGGIFFLFFLLLLSVGVAVGGYYVLSNMNLSAQPEKEIVATTPTPTPTPDVTLPKEELSVEVLNGTGTAGQAGRASTLLEDLNLVNIETGNADTEENTTTIITFSDKVSQVIQDEVVAALEEAFTKVTASTVPDQETDIVVTTGEEIE